MVSGTDTAMTPGAANNVSMSPNGDSAVVSGKVAMTNPDQAKKGKKGKVSIVLDDTKGTGEMNMDQVGYYARTEILPGFPGGQKASADFFEKNIQYPQQAEGIGVEGTVKINVAVDENGKVYAPKF
jgi:outer membrane biosynthesis protein TonB